MLPRVFRKEKGNISSHVVKWVLNLDSLSTKKYRGQDNYHQGSETALCCV